MTDKLPEHSRLGASSSDRWMNCPGSVHLAAENGARNESSVYADEGSAAHHVASECLTAELDAYEFFGETVFVGDRSFTVDADMVSAVQTYLDFCRSLHDSKATVVVEYRVHDPDFHPDFFGTVDYGVIGPAYIHVVDYKHGSGKPVDAEDNTQLRYYALALVREALASSRYADQKDLLHVGMTIVQPRLVSDDGPVKTVWMGADELLEWGETVLRPAMIRVSQTGSDDLAAGPHCQFCPALVLCPLHAQRWTTLLDPKSEDVTKMTNEDLADLADMIPLIKSRIRAIENELFTRMNRGDTVPGYKLVEKRAQRVWKEGAADLLELMFGDEVYDRALKSPAAVEKEFVGGADFVKEHAFKPKTGLTVAAITAPGAAVTVRPAEDAYRGLTSRQTTD